MKNTNEMKNAAKEIFLQNVIGMARREDAENNQTARSASPSPNCSVSSFVEVWRVQGVDSAENVVVDMSLNKKLARRPDALARMVRRISDQIEDAECEISDLRFSINPDIFDHISKSE